MKALVFAEFQGDQIKKGSLELLTTTRAAQCETHIFALGTGSENVASKLAGWGVQTAFCFDDEKLNQYNPELFSAVVGDLISSVKPDLVLASSSMLGRDLFPRAAAKTNSGFVSDCTELKISSSDLEVRKPLYAGKCTAKVEFGNCDTKIVLMRPNQLAVGEADSSPAPTVEKKDCSPADLGTTVKEVASGESQKLDLTEANIIVSGGRGMKGPEHFELLENLAGKMGATVGASRAVVDAGWVPHSMQVGQTGKTVAPSLYIAAGISGAIQHLAGMSGSKVIVAINKDADAPIFQKANYGIVGDAFEVLPALTTEVEALLNQ